MGFTVKIEERATYRIVPEDPSVGAGINVPYEVEDQRPVRGTGYVLSGRLSLEGTGRASLRAGGWARYEGGVLAEIHVPDGWRLEQWEDGEGTLTFSDEEGAR